jgi:hypothetical protein
VDPKEAQVAALQREVQLLCAENAFLRNQVACLGPHPCPVLE